MSLEYDLRNKTNLPSSVMYLEIPTIKDTQFSNFKEMVEFYSDILDIAYPADRKANIVYIECDSVDYSITSTFLYKLIVKYLDDSEGYDLNNKLPRVLEYQWSLLRHTIDRDTLTSLCDVELLVLTVDKFERDELFSLSIARRNKCRPTFIFDISDSKSNNTLKGISYQDGAYISLQTAKNAK